MSKSPRPRCSAALRDGSPCRTYALASGRCAFHEREADDRVPPAEAVAEVASVDEPGPVDVDELDLPAEAAEALAVAPGEIRDRLARDLGDGYVNLVRALSEAMGHAEKDAWLTCRECHKKAVYAAPDHKTRLDAAARWVELGLGRVKEQPAAKQPTTFEELGLQDLAAMSDDELKAYLVVMYLEDPETLDRERAKQEAIRSVLDEGGSIEAAAAAGLKALGFAEKVAA